MSKPEIVDQTANRDKIRERRKNMTEKCKKDDRWLDKDTMTRLLGWTPENVDRVIDIGLLPLETRKRVDGKLQYDLDQLRTLRSFQAATELQWVRSIITFCVRMKVGFTRDFNTREAADVWLKGQDRGKPHDVICYTGKQATILRFIVNRKVNTGSTIGVYVWTYANRYDSLRSIPDNIRG